MGIVSALNRLEDTYLLNLKELIAGNLNQKYLSEPLNGNQLLVSLIKIQ